MAEKPISVLREMRGHIEVEWEIPNFMDLPQMKNEMLDSPTFLLSDARWNLFIYPKGNYNRTSPLEEWISLYLVRELGSVDHSLLFSLGLKANGSKFKEITISKIFTNTNDSWGAPQFAKRSSFLDILKDASSDRVVTVMCTAHLLDGRRKEAACQSSCSDGIVNLSTHFEKLFHCGQRADVKLRVGDREFEVHKTVLGARSPVFDAMFSHEMTEENTGVVEIPDTEPEVLEEFLIFVYTGNFDKMTFKNAQGLYKSADKYDFCDLKTECTLRMATELSVDTVLDVLLLAATYEETELLNTATEYFLKNTGKIFATDKWYTFMFENASLTKELLLKISKKLETIA